LKRIYFFIATALLTALFIYLFFRTEKTVVNELFIRIFSREKYTGLAIFFRQHLPLPPHIIYSLPEGLWVFSITLTSKKLLLKAGRFNLDGEILPIIFAVALELFQLMNLTNGRFDLWDIGLSFLGWGIARFFINLPFPARNIFKPFNARSIICVLSYVIVFLAHVWR
jgi:hypothetical protein